MNVEMEAVRVSVILHIRTGHTIYHTRRSLQRKLTSVFKRFRKNRRKPERQTMPEICTGINKCYNIDG